MCDTWKAIDISLIIETTAIECWTTNSILHLWWEEPVTFETRACSNQFSVFLFSFCFFFLFLFENRKLFFHSTFYRFSNVEFVVSSEQMRWEKKKEWIAIVYLFRWPILKQPKSHFSTKSDFNLKMFNFHFIDVDGWMDAWHEMLSSNYWHYGSSF